MKTRPAGRVHLAILGLIILISGLLMKQWWWQIGLTILVVLMANVVFRYTIRD